MSRWLLFIVTIIFGVVVGLIYAWRINPVEYIDTSPDTLRDDYKADYVLMTAEVFNLDHDLSQAARRLALLGDLPPAETVFRAIQFAEELGYANADMNLMRSLLDALQSSLNVLETPLP